jgi:poly-beta-1,6-N-acetyl-D-glucosamine synthase
MNDSSYVIVSPTRDEEKYLQFTIDSLAAQTVRPRLWVIVNDGSGDRTADIANSAALQYHWIRVVHRLNRGNRQAGSGVMEAFYDGLALLDSIRWDFLIKLDADVSFGSDYVQRCLKRFDSDSKLGIGGGTVCRKTETGKLEPESKIDPAFHVRGATKIYRKECWEQIGGLIRAPGWDTVDELKANMLGWKTLTFPDIPLEHHRPTGKAYGTWNDLVKGGRGNYIAGYHPVFMTVKCLRRLFCKPYFIGGCALWMGFMKAYLRRAPQVPDPQLIRYFHKQQLNRLLFKKSLWDSPS